jgi:hypothetical protein
MHPNATAEHIHQALDHHNATNRMIAAKHPYANAEHLHKALNDKHEWVIDAAKNNPNYNKIMGK